MARVILFEGIDTCGKSTQIEAVIEQYPSLLYTREPGGTALGLRIREMVLKSTLASKRAEFLLFLADRAEHYAEVIQANPDKTILSDRGFLSGIGYALANGESDHERLLAFNCFALEDDLPEKIVFFMTNRETLIARMETKVLDGIELRGITYLLKVQDEMYKTLQKLEIPYLLIDATEEQEKITQKIVNYLEL